MRHYGGTLCELRQRLTLPALCAVAATTPTIPRSAVRQALDPHGWWWDADQELLAHIGDLLSLMLWQNTGDKSIPAPEPYPRPIRGAMGDDDGLTPTETFDTPEDWRAWRDAQYEKEDTYDLYEQDGQEGDSHVSD